MTFNPGNTLGPFISTTSYIPEDFEEFRVRFLDLYNDIAFAVNLRDAGVFDETEFLTGQQWSSSNPIVKRSAFRKIFFVGAIAAGVTSTTAHGITQFSTLTFTRIGGSAITDGASFNKIPLPYVSATAVNEQVQIDADDTNFRIINGAGADNITSAIVILEYLKN